MAEIDPLDRLIAIDAIRTLKARYFRFVDDRQWDELRSLLTDDAKFEFPGLGDHGDPDSAIEAIKAALTGTTTVHHGHMPEIVLTGRDAATGIWTLADTVVREAGSTGVIPNYPAEYQAGHTGCARYYESYRREHDGWRISSLRVQRVWMQPLGEGARFRAASAPAADPSTG